MRRQVTPSLFPLFRAALGAAIRAQDVLTPYFQLASGNAIFLKALPAGKITCEYDLEPKDPVVNFFVQFAGASVTFEISFDIGDFGGFTGGLTEDLVKSLLEPPCGPWIVYGNGMDSLQTHDWDGDW